MYCVPLILPTLHLTLWGRHCAFTQNWGYIKKSVFIEGFFHSFIIQHGSSRVWNRGCPWTCQKHMGTQQMLQNNSPQYVVCVRVLSSLYTQITNRKGPHHNYNCCSVHALFLFFLHLPPLSEPLFTVADCFHVYSDKSAVSLHQSNQLFYFSSS